MSVDHPQDRRQMNGIRNDCRGFNLNNRKDGIVLTEWESLYLEKKWGQGRQGSLEGDVYETYKWKCQIGRCQMSKKFRAMERSALET